VNTAAANRTDISPEVVEFRNIGCGQYILSITVTME